MVVSVLLLLCEVSIVSAITMQQAKIQIEKNTNRLEFMRRMRVSAAQDTGNEILTGSETKEYNQELISKTHPSLKGGAFTPSRPTRRMEDGADDADDNYENDDAWYEEAANYYNWNDLGVNIADYSLKYHKCTTLQSFVGEEANDADGSPFVNHKFVTFRLCPTDTCSADGWDGCRDSYGEYMMDMSEFIEIQAKYDEELFEQYCNYCETCMYFENYFYGNNRRLNHACKYYDDCSTYLDVCAEDGDDDGNDDGNNQPRLTYEDLNECIPIEDVVQDDDNYDDDGNADENAYYLGLACETTLQMAVFSDEDCTQFLGNSAYIYNITGYDIQVDDDMMGPFMSHECVSCRESEAPYKVSYQDENDNDDIVEACEEIYLASARCDSRLWDIEYEDLVDQYTDERTCDFIENVIKGNLNQYGQLVNSDTAQTSNLFHKWIPEQYWPVDDNIVVSQDEVAYLTMGFLGCMVMLVYVSYFKKQLVKHSDPLLQTNTYPCNSEDYPMSNETTITSGSYASNPTSRSGEGRSCEGTSGEVTSGEGASGACRSNSTSKFDPVDATRSID